MIKPITFYIDFTNNFKKKSEQEIYSYLKKIINSLKDKGFKVDEIKPYEDALCCNVYLNSHKLFILFGSVSPPDEKSRWVIATDPPKISLLQSLFNFGGYEPLQDDYDELNNTIKKLLQSHESIIDIHPYEEKI